MSHHPSQYSKLEAQRIALELHKSDWFVPNCNQIDVCTIDQLHVALVCLQWFEIGCGSISRVYMHATHKYLLKLFAYNHNYLTYLWWAREHQDNPHVIKIYGDIAAITDGIWATRVEILEPIDDPAFFNQYLDPNLQCNEDLAITNTPVPDHHALPANRDWLACNHPSLFEALYGIQIILGHKQLDFGGHNIMRRDSVLVYSDPIQP